MNKITLDQHRYSDNKEILSWLVVRIGTPAWGVEKVNEHHRWAWDSMIGRTTFYFRDTRDLNLFLLRWGS